MTDKDKAAVGSVPKLGHYPAVVASLPKTALAIESLLKQAKPQHLQRLDRDIDVAIRKVWASLLAKTHT